MPSGPAMARKDVTEGLRELRRRSTARHFVILKKPE